MTDREAMKMALDALKLHLLHHEHGCVYLNPVMYALEAALAQSEQAEYDKLTVKFGERAKEYLVAARNTMPTKIVGSNLEQILNAAGFYRREWVGLTDDDCIEAQKNSWNEYKNGKELKFDGFKLCKNIEQILKEKNNAI